MWYYLLPVCAYLARGSLADMSSNYYCASLNPQPHIIIPQLMGMWYAVEIINHREERHYKKIGTSCPIIHISEDDLPTSTMNSLHRDYNYGYNYGEGHGYQNQNPVVQQGVYHQEVNQRNTYDVNNSPTKKQYYDWVRQHPNLRHQYVSEMKYIRLYWDESGEPTEYHLRYNVTWPGFWISSGPDSGRALDPKFGHFAGTVQVIKAVGNHMVLTFCHQIPERQLYSVVLSREVKLDSMNIHGVHSLLNRKGLGTNAVKKVCNNGSSQVALSAALCLLIILSLTEYLNWTS